MVDTFTIPATVAEINANYDVKDTASIDRVRWLIDSWDESRNRSFLLRSKILYAGSLTLQTGAETGQLDLADTSVSEDERRINDIRVILKVCTGLILSFICIRHYNTEIALLCSALSCSALPCSVCR